MIIRLIILILILLISVNTKNRENNLFELPIEKEGTSSKKIVFEISDSICLELGVPPKLIREIGYNESRWIWKSKGKHEDRGYLQIIPSTFDYWYNKLELEGGHTQKNHLVVGITYLKWQYNRYGSWKKARFAYGRGHWRDSSTWTKIERRFMKKINWQEYGT